MFGRDAIILLGGVGIEKGGGIIGNVFLLTYLFTINYHDNVALRSVEKQKEQKHPPFTFDMLFCMLEVL